MRKPRITVMGGELVSQSLFVVCVISVDITAVVTVADDGGSSNLRDILQ
ncbi:MAG: hypothetical protein ACLTZB_00205 [Streptococcus salivarius]